MSNPISRRSALLGVAAMTGLALTTRRAGAAGDATAFGSARERWVGMMAADPARVDGSANAVLRKLRPEPGRPSLWPDLPLGNPANGNFNRSYNRMRALALGWATPGTRMHRDPDVARTAIKALDFLHRHAYNEHADRRGSNWYWWEIGVPRALTDTCALLYEALPGDSLTRWLRPLHRWCPNADHRVNNPSVAETGANRAGKVMAVAMHGVLTHNPRLIGLARDGISDRRGHGRWSLLRLTNGPGDGFYRDGSFIQHDRFPYTGSYGVDYLDSIAKLITLLAGSPWEITDPDLGNIFDVVDRSFVPVMFDGLMMDGLRGRQISVQGHRDYTSGQRAMEAILHLLPAAPEAHAGRWRPLVKGWLSRNLTLTAPPGAKDLMTDPAIPAGPRTVGTYVFAGMDRVVHRRPTWAYAISMSSSRIAAVEGMNRENLRGWFTGDGMTYLYTDDLTHWNDELWPTIDPYRLPGTTVDRRKRGALPYGARYRPHDGWAGGAALDNRYGVAAMRLNAQHSSLRAKKAWFLLDDAVIALGAGITASDGRRVETTVDNRNTHTKHPPLAKGDGWLHLHDTAGYVLLGDHAKMKVVREKRTGRWHDIDRGATTGGDKERHTRHYTTIVLDHGKNPDAARYAYAVLPATDAATTAAFAEDPQVKVLANTSKVQAIRTPDLLAAVFWRAASVDGLAADAACTVLVSRYGSRVRVAVSDPSRKAEKIRITLPWEVHSLEDAGRTVSLRKRTLTVKVGGTRGRTHTATLTVPTTMPPRHPMAWSPY
ncbi:polysaccharide lyase 8 family protein [Nonomuraea sp. NBC_01738]|uniref:polysaccharide lyase 8 family protein n=1 Tax=Nonomuraea sp. NBC_01738 TaxID=2976003 RepID=UPI002E0D2933|nr:polysaccharide lyase 8 family protein [Nonomuraea sp. NBC_01738]